MTSPRTAPFIPLGNLLLNLRTGLNPRDNFRLNTEGASNFYITVRELAGFDIRPSASTDLVDDVALSRIQNRSKLQTGDVLFSGTGTIGRTALVEDHPSNWNIKEGVYALTPESDRLSSRYLVYVLGSAAVASEIQSKADGSTVVSISMKSLKSVRIPVPSMPVQEEIVRILDAFTTLEAELEAEFGARKSQYEHYLHAHIRECNISGSRVRLGDVCKVLNGFAFKSELFNNDQNGLPLIRIRDVNSGISGTYYSGDFDPNFLVDNGDLLIGMDGEFNAIRWRGGQALLNQRVCRLQEFSESVSIDYISHIVKAALKTIERNTAASTVKHLSSKQIANIELRLPTLDKQREVAQFLSRLDELISDREFGIPAEIETRKKQYEHYRDQLLAFEEA